MFTLKKRKFNKTLRILLVTNAVILLATYMLGPIYALFVERVGGSLLDASFAGGVFALAGGLTVLLSGRLSDKVKHPEWIVSFGYLIIGLGFLLYIIADSIWFLLLVQAVIGFGEAIYSPAFDGLYSNNLDSGKSGTEWGIWEAMNYFTAAIGAVIGGFIVTYYGFNSLFIIMAGLSFISAAYTLGLSKDR